MKRQSGDARFSGPAAGAFSSMVYAGVKTPPRRALPVAVRAAGIDRPLVESRHGTGAAGAGLSTILLDEVDELLGLVFRDLALLDH